MKLTWKVLMAGVILFLIVLFVNIRRSSPADAQGPDAHDPEVERLFVSEPITPGLSLAVPSLPTVEPRKPGDPVHEVNPRQPGDYMPASSDGRVQTKDATHSCQRKTPGVSD